MSPVRGGTVTGTAAGVVVDVDGVVAVEEGVDAAGVAVLSEAQPAKASRVVRPATHAHAWKRSMGVTLTGQVFGGAASPRAHS